MPQRVNFCILSMRARTVTHAFVLWPRVRGKLSHKWFQKKKKKNSPNPLSRMTGSPQCNDDCWTCCTCCVGQRGYRAILLMCIPCSLILSFDHRYMYVYNVHAVKEVIGRVGGNFKPCPSQIESTSHHYITKSTRPFQFFSRVLKNMGRPG